MPCNGPDVVILSGDFTEMERKSCFRMMRSHLSDEDLSPGTPTSLQGPSSLPRMKLAAMPSFAIVYPNRSE